MVKMIKRWLPVVIWMGVMYFFSSQPSMKAVRFDWVDFIIKKTAHIVEYMVLFVLLFRAIEGKVRREWAYILGIVYAFFDETHQLFSPGRTGMLRDILIFDNLGLLVGWVVSKKYKFIDKWWKK